MLGITPATDQSMRVTVAPATNWIAQKVVIWGFFFIIFYTDRNNYTMKWVGWRMRKTIFRPPPPPLFVIFIGNVAMLRSCWENEQSEAETKMDRTGWKKAPVNIYRRRGLDRIDHLRSPRRPVNGQNIMSQVELKPLNEEWNVLWIWCNPFGW